MVEHIYLQRVILVNLLFIFFLFSSHLHNYHIFFKDSFNRPVKDMMNLELCLNFAFLYLKLGSQHAYHG